PAECVTGQHLGNLHDLFLVQNDAVGRLQRLGQRWMRMHHPRPAVLAGDESSTMPDSSGPGRYSATSAMMSSNEAGSRRLMSRFMPADSSWNTAVVSPALSSSKVAQSSIGIWRMSIGSALSCSR